MTQDLPPYYVVQISEQQRKLLVHALTGTPAGLLLGAKQLLSHLDRLPGYEELRPDCLHDITG